jgi:polar amino acid transport system substrate-binding protein
MPRLLVTLVLASLTSAPALTQSPTVTLAPTGTLRAVFLGGNPVHGRVDPVSGAATGVVPDLVNEFARRLGVPAKIVSAPNATGVVAAMKSGTADIGFLAFDEERARDVDFGEPFLVMLNSYLVRADSGIRSNADVDRVGLIVAAARGASQQLFVSRTLKSAQIRLFEAVPPQAELERLLGGGEVHAFAINRQRSLEAEAASAGRLRALPDSFMKVDQSVIAEKGNRAKLEILNRFVTELRASGFIRDSVARAKLTGVELTASR